jgi:cytochrome c-type biogenesis protein CcmH/NrfF
MVRAGDSDAQVEAFVVGKYGEEEIIAPHGLSGWIAIGIPAVGFVVAAGALVAGVLRRRRLSSTPTVPREVDLALVDQALRDRRAVR